MCDLSMLPWWHYILTLIGAVVVAVGVVVVFVRGILK